jgi:flavin reductase (DIM6/NTAB) family NADH-FMN oxidoreductase RutF
MKIDAATMDDRQMHSLLGSVIVPLPIAFISTVDENGIYNAAPYSLVFPVSWDPPIICVSFGLKRGQKKDTLKNIESSKNFVINIMDETFIKPVLKAAAEYPSEVDEIKKVGLTALSADKVSSPRISEAKVSLECRFTQILELGAGEKLRTLIFGEVQLLHIKDDVWVNNKIDPSRLKAVGRLSGVAYCRTTDILKLGDPRS